MVAKIIRQVGFVVGVAACSLVAGSDHMLCS
jgi:hypothetical protein